MAGSRSSRSSSWGCGGLSQMEVVFGLVGSMAAAAGYGVRLMRHGSWQQKQQEQQEQQLGLVVLALG